MVKKKKSDKSADNSGAKVHTVKCYKYAKNTLNT